MEDNYVAPYAIPQNQDTLPEGVFLLPVCTTRERLTKTLAALVYARGRLWRDHIEYDHMIDILAALAFIDNPNLSPCYQCEGDDMYLLRQNPANPCQLQQSTDGGVNWSLAFDYELCLFQQSLNPPDVRIDPVTGAVQYSIDDGVTWVDAPKPSDKTPLRTDIFQEKSDPACWHAANATELIRRMVMDSGDDLLLIIDIVINILLTIITGGATLPLLITNLVSAALAFGLGAIRSHMEQPGEWDKLQKILYCNHDESWGWSPLGWDAALDEIGVEFPPGVALFLGGLIQVMGSIGLTNAGYLALVESADCSAYECGDTDCGFTTNSASNANRWNVATEMFNPSYYGGTLGCTIQQASPPLSYGGSNTLGANTLFVDRCYITSVTLYTLGRGAGSHVGVAVRTTPDGEWTEIESRNIPSWAAGVPQVFTVNAPVYGVQVQSLASAGQNNFSTITIGDPTP